MDCFPSKLHKVPWCQRKELGFIGLLGREILSDLVQDIKRDRIQEPAILFYAGKLQCEKYWAENSETRALVFILKLTSYVTVSKSHHIPLGGLLGDSKILFSSKNVNISSKTSGQLTIFQLSYS